MRIYKLTALLSAQPASLGQIILARPAPNFDCCFRFHPTGEEQFHTIRNLLRQLILGSKETVEILVSGLVGGSPSVFSAYLKSLNV